MRANRLFGLALLLLPSGPAAAIAVAPCEGVGGGAPAPPQDFPCCGTISLLTPRQQQTVPRNVELRLTGQVSILTQDPPWYELALIEDGSGEAVPLRRDGALLKPTALLQPNATYRFVITPVGENAGWETEQVTVLYTNDVVDTEAPLVPVPDFVHVFVQPDPQSAAECGFFVSATHVVHVRMQQPQAEDAVSLSFASLVQGGQPTSLLEMQVTPGQGIDFSLQGGAEPVGLGDDVYLAVSARDLAGNTGPATIVRARARSFSDATQPPGTLEPLMCEMPSAAAVHAAAALPLNGRIQVDFPFEKVPMALVREGGEQIALHAVVDADGSQVLEPIAPLPPGETLRVVPLSCDSCICSGCDVLPAGEIVVGSDEDTTAPAAPVVLGLREDLDPAPSTGACRPDHTALVVEIEPGEDDLAQPTELRYDAALRVDGGARLQVGRALAPVALADGTVAVRLPTAALGRLLPRSIDLELTALDQAGNRSSSQFVHEPGGPSCAAHGTTGGGARWGIAAIVGMLAVGRRRRR